MSDLETLKAMLDRAKVVYRIDHEDDQLAEGANITTLGIVEGAGPNNGGYSGFITVWEFDEKGCLMSVDNWE